MRIQNLLKRAIFLLPFLLAFPAYGQSQQAANTPARLTIKSEVLNEERTILVRTPPGYEQGRDRYPVLYMTDGDAHIQHTSATISFLARNGRIPELIVVAITNTDRTRDLTPTNASFPNPNGTALQFPTSGGADKFLKFIETEVIPHIEGKYRTQPYRIFAGHSFGGLFALHALLSRPELFNAYIAVSPSFPWDNQLPVRRAEEFFKERKELKRTLYFTLGSEGPQMQAGFDRFKEILNQNQPKGFEWGALQMEDEDHGSVVLRSHYAALRKVFDGWQAPRDPATGQIAGGIEGVEAHYKKLSEKFGYPILVPEALTNQFGYQLMGQGKMEEAIKVFKTNVDRYPNSANVYDSLAEAYEKSDRLDLAQPNYEKAYTLGKESNDQNVEIFKTNLERVTQRAKQGNGTGKK
jgi:uncharacterized protein